MRFIDSLHMAPVSFVKLPAVISLGRRLLRKKRQRKGNRKYRKNQGAFHEISGVASGSITSSLNSLDFQSWKCGSINPYVQGQEPLIMRGGGGSDPEFRKNPSCARVWAR